MLEKNRLREELQATVREREKAIEASRTAVLRLLGEVSTLRNQLAQMNEYLAGIERETARVAERRADCRRRAGAAGHGARRAFRNAWRSARWSWNRSPASASAPKRISATAARPPSRCARRIDQLRTECSRLKARKESLEEVLAHRSYTTESVKRLFAALEKGKAQDLRPQGVLADFVEVDPQFEKPAEEFLHDELEYVVVEGLGAGRSRPGFPARRTGRPRHVPGASREERQRPRASARAGHRPGDRHLARLSDSLRLTNGLTDRAATLLPRVSLCFLAEDRASAQRLATAIRTSTS